MSAFAGRILNFRQGMSAVKTSSAQAFLHYELQNYTTWIKPIEPVSNQPNTIGLALGCLVCEKIGKKERIRFEKLFCKSRKSLDCQNKKRNRVRLSLFPG